MKITSRNVGSEDVDIDCGLGRNKLLCRETAREYALNYFLDLDGGNIIQVFLRLSKNRRSSSLALLELSQLGIFKTVF